MSHIINESSTLSTSLAWLLESFEVGSFIVEVGGLFCHLSQFKESEEYPSRVAGKKHKVDGDFRWLPAISNINALPSRNIS